MKVISIAAKGYIATLVSMDGQYEVAVRRHSTGTPIAMWKVQRNVDSPRSGKRTPRVSFHGTPAYGYSSDSFSTCERASLRDIALCAIETYVIQNGGAS